MKKPKISVIITAYNVGKYIDEAIKSVLSQTFKDYELIVVDDGSTDNTKNVITKYKDRLRYYYKENGGHASAKNYGIRKSKSDLVAFLDGDDVWLPKRLELGYNCMLKNSDAGLVYSTFSTINLSGQILNNKYNILKIKKIYPQILLGNFVGFSSTLVKRECFEKCGYFYSVVDMYEDWDLWIRISRKYDFFYIDEPLFYYRSTKANNWSDEHINLRLKRLFLVINRSFKEDHNINYFFKLRCISNVYFDIAKACFFRRQFIETIKLNLISILYMPLQIKAYLFFPSIIVKKVSNSIWNGLD